jgi:hypothetical protein
VTRYEKTFPLHRSAKLGSRREDGTKRPAPTVELQIAPE